jgi:hypothetical protein
LISTKSKSQSSTAAEQCRSGVSQWIADRSSATNQSLSHGNECFFRMQQNAGADQSITACSNDFYAENFSALRSADHVDIVRSNPSFEGETSCGLL